MPLAAIIRKGSCKKIRGADQGPRPRIRCSSPAVRPRKPWGYSGNARSPRGRRPWSCLWRRRVSVAIDARRVVVLYGELTSSRDETRWLSFTERVVVERGQVRQSPSGRGEVLARRAGEAGPPPGAG